MILAGQKAPIEEKVYCQIIREKLYEQQFQKIAKGYKRIAEIENAIDWALARNPQKFDHIKEELYLWRYAKLADDFPHFRIAFTLNPITNQVTLLEIEEIK